MKEDSRFTVITNLGDYLQKISKNREEAHKTEKMGTTNKPEERQLLIHEQLKKENYEIIILETNSKEGEEKLKKLKERIVELGVHSKRYLDFLENVYQSWIESGDKKFLKLGGLVPSHFSRKKQEHEKNVEKLPFWKQSGYFCDDVMTP